MNINLQENLLFVSVSPPKKEMQLCTEYGIYDAVTKLFVFEVCVEYIWLDCLGEKYKI